MGSFPGGAFLALLVTMVLGGGIAACEKTLVNIIPPTSLQISPSPVSLLEGEQEALRARLFGPDGEPLTGRTVAWRIDDSAVASISTSGVLRGLSEGVTFARAEAGGLQASVTVTVLKGPTIELSADGLQLEGPSEAEVPLEVAVLVENAGNGTVGGLSATAETDGAASGWLITSLDGSSAPTVLMVQALLEDLEPGDYSGTITVSSTTALNSPQTLPVDLRVGEPLPEMRLMPSAVALGAAAGTFQPATEEVDVENTGGGVLAGLAATVTYVSGGAVGWLTPTFEDAQAPTTLEISASARFLAPGTYVATVEVTSTSAPEARGTVRVTFTVQ